MSHHFPVVPQAEDQAFNAWAFESQSRFTLYTRLTVQSMLPSPRSLDGENSYNPEKKEITQNAFLNYK